MAAGTFTLYTAHKGRLVLGDLVGATLKLGLLGAAHTPNTAYDGHVIWGNVSGDEIAAGNGYSAGGIALTGKAVTNIPEGFKFSTANAVWTATGGNIPAWRYGVLYVAGSLWGYASPLLGYFLGDDAPADIPVTASGNLLTVVCPADGWFDVT